jgi:hypothetical protein
MLGSANVSRRPPARTNVYIIIDERENVPAYVQKLYVTRSGPELRVRDRPRVADIGETQLATKDSPRCYAEWAQRVLHACACHPSRELA